MLGLFYPTALANLFRGSTLDPDLPAPKPVPSPQPLTYERAEPAVTYARHSFKPKSLEQHREEFRTAFQTVLTRVESELRSHPHEQPNQIMVIPGVPARLKGSSRKTSTPVGVLRDFRHGPTDMVQFTRTINGVEKIVSVPLERLDQAQAKLVAHIARLAPTPVAEPLPIAAE